MGRGTVMDENKDFREAVEALFRGEEHSNVVEYFYSDPDHAGDVVNGVALWSAFINNGKYYVLDSEISLINKSLKKLSGKCDTIKRLLDFGCGTADATEHKVLPLLQEFNEAAYHPVDLSQDFITSATGKVKAALPDRKIVPHHQDFTKRKRPLSHEKGTLGVFFGNTIANIPGHFNGKVPKGKIVKTLSALGRWLQPGDRLLITHDANTDRESLMECYDSPECAEFTKNLMHRIARDLISDSGFKPDAWRYEAIYNEGTHCLSNCLTTTEEMTFGFNGQTYYFPEGHRLVVANSYKYPVSFMKECAEEAGYKVEKILCEKNNHMVMQVLTKTP